MPCDGTPSATLSRFRFRLDGSVVRSRTGLSQCANKSSASALVGPTPPPRPEAVGGVHRTRRSACDPPRVAASPSVGRGSARRRSVLARLRKTFRFQSGRGVWIRLEADDEVIAECECCSAVVLSLDDRIILVDGPPLHRPDRDSGVTAEG